LPMGLKSGSTRLAGLLGRGRCEIFGMAKIGEFRFSPTNCNKTFYRKGKTLNFTHSYRWAAGTLAEGPSLALYREWVIFGATHSR
jgi:hypothetical protein